MQNPIIVFGAHPDDIEIGMGGTVKKLTAGGKRVISCIASIPNQVKTRRKETNAAAKVLGVREVVYLSLPKHDLGFNRKTVGAIDRIIEKFQPRSVFTHWVGDSHQDHIHLTHAVLAACRHNHFNVYMYEQTIPGGITYATFRPQLFIDISPYIDDKIKSIQAHKTQCGKYGDGWADGLKGRAMHRGYQIKTGFAEAFEIVKVKEDIGIL